MGCTLAGTSGFNNSLRKTLNNQQIWIVGCAFNFAVLPSSTAAIFRFLDGTTTQNEINVNAAGNMVWTRNGTVLATGTVVLSAGVFYYIECMTTIAASITAGSCVLHVNGIADITLAATTNTQNTANAYAQTVEILTFAGVNTAIDDVYICDGTGTANNSILGDVRVEAILPNAAGAFSAWTPLSGTNFSQVDQTSEDGDTTYVSSATAGNEDTYLFGSMVSSPLNIFGIQTTVVNRMDDAGPHTIKSIIRIAAVDYPGATVGQASTYAFDTEIHETNPATAAAWTAAAVNALEAGVSLVS